MTDKDKDFSPEPAEAGTEFIRDDEAAGPSPEASPERDDEVERLRTRFAYLAAEFDNYRKRSAREKEAVVAYGNERLLGAILPFLDNLERAISQAGAAGTAEPVVEGVRLTYDQLLAELKKFGLSRIAAEGQMFDPNAVLPTVEDGHAARQSKPLFARVTWIKKERASYGLDERSVTMAENDDVGSFAGKVRLDIVARKMRVEDVVQQEFAAGQLDHFG